MPLGAWLLSPVILTDFTSHSCQDAEHQGYTPGAPQQLFSGIREKFPKPIRPNEFFLVAQENLHTYRPNPCTHELPQEVDHSSLQCSFRPKR